jgi:serine/threonine-protein kinase
VCKVYEVGEEDGRPYIAMELVDGEPLDRAATKLTVEQKVLLVKRVIEAIQAAHAVGLVHCDLNPANILVASVGQTKLTTLLSGLHRSQHLDTPAAPSPIRELPAVLGRQREEWRGPPSRGGGRAGGGPGVVSGPAGAEAAGGRHSAPNPAARSAKGAARSWPGPLK